MKKKDKSFYYYLLAFLIPLIFMTIIYCFANIYPFGKKSILTVDMAGQYIAFFNAFKNMLSGSVNIFYSFSKALGGNMFGLITYYLLSPFNLILMLFNKFTITDGILLINLLKIGACGLTSYIYFHKTFKDKGVIPLCFSSCYALMAYNIIYSQNLLWLDGVMMLPIVFLGIDKLIEKKKPLLFYISLTLTICFNYYIGYMICIGSLVYFIYKTYINNNYTLSWKKNKKDLFYFMKYAVLSALTTCFILLPSIFSLMAGKASFNPNDLIPSETYASIELISRVFIGSFSTTDLSEGCPNIYISLFMIILAFTYFYNPKFKKEEKRGTLYLIIFFIVSFIFYPVDIIWHLFQHPAGFPFRYSFIFDFIILIIAYRNYRHVKEIDRSIFKKLIPATIILTLIMDKLMYTANLNYKIIASGILIIIYLLYLYNNDKQKISKMIAVVIVLEMTINGILVVTELKYQNRSTYLNFLNDYGSVVDYVNENDSSFYRLEKEYSYSTNDPLLLNYKGLSHFSSTYEGDNNSLLGNYLGIFNRFYITNYKGSTPVTNSIFDIKYLILNEENNFYKYINKYETTSSTNKVATDKEEIYLYENNYNLPLAFLVNNDIENLNLSLLEPFINQNNILNAMSGKNSNVFIPGTITNVIIDNLKLKENSEDPYIYNRIDNQLSASLTYKVKVRKTGELYAYISSNYNKKINIIVNGESVIDTSDQNDYRYNVLDLGNYNYNDTVELKIVLLENQIKFNDVMFYSLDENKFKNQIEILNKNNSLDITSYTDSNIKGTINVEEDNQILYTSIPYDEGWKVLVDGKETDKKVLLNSLIGVNLSKGEHEIEFIYTPRGLKTGIIISVIAFLTTIVLIIKKR